MSLTPGSAMIHGAIILLAVVAASAENRCPNDMQWRATTWINPCSRTCGGGRQFRAVRCATANGTTTLPNSDCSICGPSPPSVRRCSLHNCPPEIFRKPYGKCDNCFRNRTLQCRVRKGNGFHDIVSVQQCGRKTATETDICSHEPGCLVVWKPFSYPCCHSKASEGYQCVNTENDVVVPNFVCDKLTHVGNLGRPIKAACHEDVSCLPITTPPPPVTTTLPPRPRPPPIEDHDNIVDPVTMVQDSVTQGAGGKTHDGTAKADANFNTNGTGASRGSGALPSSGVWSVNTLVLFTLLAACLQLPLL